MVVFFKGPNYEKPPADYEQSYNPPAYEPPNYYPSEAPPIYTEAPTYDAPAHTEAPFPPPHAFTEQPNFTEASVFNEEQTFSPPTQTETTFPLLEEPAPDQPERNRYPNRPGHQGFFNNNDFPEFDDFFKQMIRG